MSATLSLNGNERVLVVRLGAMGDILHALPAVECLKRRYPAMSIDWIVKPRWTPLLGGNPALRRVIPFDREQGSVWAMASRLRDAGYHLAIDLQGLIQSALVAKFSGARTAIGYARAACREPLAALFYGHRIQPDAPHIAGMHLDLMRALGVVDSSLACTLPTGEPEGTLPEGPFVLASPFAGWQNKQWPLAHFQRLAALLAAKEGIPLVMNVAEADLPRLGNMAGAVPHSSSLAGLIHATRCAAAVVGVDSGPLHLAAALGKPGVALFGPTDPVRNGPLSPSIVTLRDSSATVSYKRVNAESESMRNLAPETVFEAVRAALHASGASSAAMEQTQ